MIDRSDAVNLARNYLADPARGITDKGIECLAKAVLRMDGTLSVLPEAALPSGWLAVPVAPTIAMHNAAALSDIYETPRLKMDDDGYVRVVHACPDWSRVWRAMVNAAPACTAALDSEGSKK